MGYNRHLWDKHYVDILTPTDFKKIWAFPSLFLDFIFFLGSLFILQLTNIDDNGDRKQERRVKSIQHSIPHSFRKSPAPSKNRLAAILNRKNPSPSQESNPAFSDRMPLPYRLRHHHGLQ